MLAHPDRRRRLRHRSVLPVHRHQMGPGQLRRPHPTIHHRRLATTRRYPRLNSYVRSCLEWVSQRDIEHLIVVKCRSAQQQATDPALGRHESGQISAVARSTDTNAGRVHFLMASKCIVSSNYVHQMIARSEIAPVTIATAMTAEVESQASRAECCHGALGARCVPCLVTA